MKCDTDLAWELIGHDPVLRQQLIAIEQSDSTTDCLVNELLEFYNKIERMIILTEKVLLSS